MANTFETLADYAPLARVGAKMVANDLKIASTFNRDLEGEFGGKRGMTVNIKIPSALVARAKSSANPREAIIVDEIVQSHFSVSIDGLAYSSVELDEWEAAYKVEDFASEVLQPQTEAVADYVENESIEALKGVEDSTQAGGMLAGALYNPNKPEDFFVSARKRLMDNGLPASGLWAAVGTQVYADLLNADALKDASQSGSTDALRDAQTGKVRGFTVVEAPMLDENEIVFYGRHSFTLVVRAPKVPRGAAGGASVSAGGFASRLVYDYDATTQVDRSTVSAFVSVANMPVWKIERDYTTKEATVVEKPSALRVPDVSAMLDADDDGVLDV
jgi:hypothetical protein